MCKEKLETVEEKTILEKFGKKTLEIGKLPNLKFETTLGISEYKITAFLKTPGYYIAFQKWKDLYHTFTSAQYALVQSSHSHHQGIYSNKPGFEQLWLRSEFAKNAIIWYNSCYDLFLQIIYFAYDFSKPVDSPETYSNEMINCRFDSKVEDWKGNKNGFKQLIDNHNEEAQKLYEKLIDFYFKKSADKKDNKIKEWANILKHRGGIDFQGIYTTPKTKRIFESPFDTSYIQPLILNIDDVIELLISEHKKIVEFADFLYEFMEFDTLEKISDTDILFKGVHPQKFSAKD